SGRLDVLTAIPGGGTLAVSGMVRPPPAASQLRLRVTNLQLAPWTQFLPVAALIEGTGEADLRIDEPLAAGGPARVRGSMAVNRLGVRDAGREMLGAQRVEATGLEVQWPTRLTVERLLVSGPRGTVERDRGGDFPLRDLVNRPGAAPDGAAAGAEAGRRPAATTPAVGLEVGEIVVRGGTVAWRDEAVSPPAALRLPRT